MVSYTYDESLRRLLLDEGGYTNHPSDPGGPTNFGITIHDYRKYINPNGTANDVRTMKVEEAKAIYKAKYWNAMRCDELPAGIDYAVFDYGVNSGIGRAPKVLQRVLGINADGRIGPETLEAAKRANAQTVINGICDERMRFLQALRTWPVFGTGWGRRVKGVRTAALAMAKRASSQPVLVPDPSGPSSVGKGVVPVNTTARNTTTGGVAAGGGAAASQAPDAFIAGAIIFVTIALMIGAWLYWQYRQKQQQEAPA